MVNDGNALIAVLHTLVIANNKINTKNSCITVCSGNINNGITNKSILVTLC